MVTHIEPVGGNVHIQISGTRNKWEIDPTNPISDQVIKHVKGSKGAIEKIVSNVEKGLRKLEELTKDKQ